MPQNKLKHHVVVVGNIGTVIDWVGRGGYVRANDAFLSYKKVSKEGIGRAAGEDVTWFIDGEIYKEYVGSLSLEEVDP